jgi:hypothetical protein
LIDWRQLIKEELKDYVPNPEHFLDTLSHHFTTHAIVASILLKILFGIKNDNWCHKPVELKEEKKLVSEGKTRARMDSNKKRKDLDVFGLVTGATGYNTRNHYNSFIHDAFEFKNKFFLENEISLTKPGSPVNTFSYNEIKDHLPISLLTGKKISMEEWNNGYLEDYKTLLLHSYPEDTSNKQVRKNKRNKVVGNIYHASSMREKLVPDHSSLDRTYKSLNVQNVPYFVKRPGPPLESTTVSADEGKEEKKSNYLPGIFDYSTIINSCAGQGTDQKDEEVKEEKNNKKSKSYTSVQQFMEDSCDLDFTKIAYDGNKLHIYSLESLLTKSSVVNISRLFDRMLEKCGIEGREVYSQTNINRIQMFYFRLLCRQQKYFSRGFQVRLEFDAARIDIGRLRGIILGVQERHLSLKTTYSVKVYDDLVASGHIVFV